MNKIIFSLVAFILFTTHLVADEIKMAYLQVDEHTKDNFSVILKVPIKTNLRIQAEYIFPNTCKKTSQLNRELINKSYLYNWNLSCKEGLVGKNIEINNLKKVSTDLLLQLNLHNNISYTAILSSKETIYRVPTELSLVEVMSTYSFLGIEHILQGFDHLLFVFALLLIVKNIRQLIWTITAFTLAHSITLGGASLGFISLPSKPIEAVIALSILFLAIEILHQRKGINGITSRFPWLVSFIFGLLHGFGFAGALTEIGLPEQSITLALLFFNVGVEIGQLLFVSVVLFIGFALKKLNQNSLLEKSQLFVIYAIGSLSSFWFIQRVVSFF